MATPAPGVGNGPVATTTTNTTNTENSGSNNSAPAAAVSNSSNEATTPKQAPATAAQGATASSTTATGATTTITGNNYNNTNSNAAAVGLTTPTSPPYPPYGYMDPAHYDRHHHPNGGGAGGFDEAASSYTYVYPLSPQFSVQYYSDLAGYQSYPGSPALHPQSPPVNPTSPPFSPTFQYQHHHHHQQPSSAGGITLSPPTHAYVLPPHHQQHHHFPPLHISSPVLTGTASVPGSPPHQYIQPLPGSYSLSTDQRHHKRHHSPPQQHEIPDHPVNYHSHNIYVRGLSSTTTDESFMELCRVYGKISSSKAIIDQKTGECKGYGFTMYENADDCHLAIDGLNKAGLQASFARVGQESFSSRLRSLQDETSTNIYISNLPLDMTEQKLEDLFEPHKTISNRILRDPQSSMSRGVGFARLSDRASATAIIERFNGQTVLGSSAPLQVRFADSPAQKKLKNQTARKRILRPRDFQPMAGFPVRPMMPITPETMLGIAPAGSQPYYQDQQQQYVHYTTTSVITNAVSATAEQHKHQQYSSPTATLVTEDSATNTTTEQQVKAAAETLASPPDDDIKDLASQVEQKLQIAAGNGGDSTISVSH
ncbi:hypothetical protein BDB00DRAFT_929076 [Zychaea mexicana]|uniref:uncharacterized protein n=1 Tax=Zychaea mexicana TaxID=64656 RepID=UPI0022FE6773|nr:uncharacterized protein BDB00DRAFT_929076 [Zychaea mexicana]KAI9493384.1 hypothetical protein BDB00DRAFT_929076 [Zychaea mexicana]